MLFNRYKFDELVGVLLGNAKLNLKRWANLESSDREFREKYYAIEKIERRYRNQAEEAFIELIGIVSETEIKRALVLALGRVSINKGIIKLLTVLDEENGFVFNSGVYALCNLYHSKDLKPELRDKVKGGLMKVLENLDGKAVTEELAAIGDTLKNDCDKDIDIFLERNINIDPSDIGCELYFKTIDYRKRLKMNKSR